MENRKALTNDDPLESHKKQSERYSEACNGSVESNMEVKGIIDFWDGIWKIGKRTSPTAITGVTIPDNNSARRDACVRVTILITMGTRIYITDHCSRVKIHTRARIMCVCALANRCHSTLSFLGERTSKSAREVYFAATFSNDWN